MMFCVCVCMSVCLHSKMKNSLRYRHQSLHRYSPYQSPALLRKMRSKVKGHGNSYEKGQGLTLCCKCVAATITSLYVKSAGEGLDVDMTAHMSYSENC